MIEKKVENQVKEYWQLFVDKGQGYFVKTQGNQYSRNGTPDYTGSIMGKYVGIEAKAGNSHKLALIQAFNGAKIVISGGVFVTAYPDFNTYKSINEMPVYTLKLTPKIYSSATPLKLGDGVDYSAFVGFVNFCNKTKKTCRLVVKVL